MSLVLVNPSSIICTYRDLLERMCREKLIIGIQENDWYQALYTKLHNFIKKDQPEAIKS